MRKKSQQHGFSLLELITVIAIFGIALSVALPSYFAMMDRQDMAKVTSQFQTSLNFARQTAYVSGRDVSVCAVENIVASAPLNCTGWGDLNSETSELDTGWIIFQDKNNDNVFNPSDDDRLYKSIPYRSNKTSISWSNSSNVITLAPRGSTGDAGTLSIFNADDAEENPNDYSQSQVALTPLGRVSVSVSNN